MGLVKHAVDFLSSNVRDSPAAIFFRSSVKFKRFYGQLFSASFQFRIDSIFIAKQAEFSSHRYTTKDYGC